MDDTDTLFLVDYQGRVIRLTVERHAHILKHPEMRGQVERIAETLAEPDVIISTLVDSSVRVYHRLYPTTPVTRKYLLVAVKVLEGDAFLLTAFFSNHVKKGSVVWKR